MATMSREDVEIFNGFTAEETTGEIVSSEKQTSVSVETSGGNYPGPYKSLNLDPIRVHGRERHTHELWVRDDEGREHHLTIGGHQIPLRVGQRVTVAFIFPKDSKVGEWAVLLNHHTQQWQPMDSYWRLAQRLTRGGWYVVAAAVALALLPFFSTDPTFTVPGRLIAALGVMFAVLILYAPIATARHLMLRSKIKKWAFAYAHKRLQPATGAAQTARGHGVA